MADFRIDKEFVRNFVEKNKAKYVISQEQIENICMMYDTFLNENNSLYRSDSLTKQNICALFPSYNTNILFIIGINIFNIIKFMN